MVQKRHCTTTEWILSTTENEHCRRCYEWPPQTTLPILLLSVLFNCKMSLLSKTAIMHYPQIGEFYAWFAHSQKALYVQWTQFGNWFVTINTAH